MMNSVARKEWTPKWGRWTLDADRECPVLVIRPFTCLDVSRPYEVALFKPGCTEEEFYKWLGRRVWQIQRAPWAAYKDVYMFVDAATDIRGWGVDND
jgi:hypothetical protein